MSEVAVLFGIEPILLQDRGIRRSGIDVFSVLPHRVGPSVIVDSRLVSRPHRRPGLLNRRGPPLMPRAELGIKASGRSKLTREPKQIDAQLGKQMGAEFSALFVKRCLVALSGLCRPVWISRMTKPAEDRVTGEFNPAGRLMARKAWAATGRD